MISSGINLPRCHHATRGLSSKLGHQSVTLIKDISLLLDAHGIGVLMSVTVESELVTGIENHLHVFRKCLERMARDKPSGLDVVFGKDLQHAFHAHCAAKPTCRN